MATAITKLVHVAGILREDGTVTDRVPVPIRPADWFGLRVQASRLQRDGFVAVPVVIREIAPGDLERERETGGCSECHYALTDGGCSIRRQSVACPYWLGVGRAEPAPAPVLPSPVPAAPPLRPRPPGD